MPDFVNGAAAGTPAGSSDTSVVVTIPATSAGNDLLVSIGLGSDPDPMTYVTGIVAAGAAFDRVGGAAVAAQSGSRSVREEVWRARGIAADIVSVTVTVAAAFAFGVCVGEYAGVQGIGVVRLAQGTAVPVTVTVPTQDRGNRVVAAFAAENLAGADFTGADAGVFREHVFVFGAGSVDVPTALLDNTAALPSDVVNTVTTSAQSLWVAVGVELRGFIGGSW